jgi:hypothetical protein
MRVVAIPHARARLREETMAAPESPSCTTFRRGWRSVESTEVAFEQLVQHHQPLFENNQHRGDNQKRLGGQQKTLCVNLEQLEVKLEMLFRTLRCLDRTSERLFLTFSSTDVDQKRLA